MLFGSASGLVRHARQRTIDPRAALELSAVAVPAAVAGALVSPRVPTGWLLGLFGGFCLLYGLALLLGRSAPTALPASWAVAAAGGACTGLITVGVGAMLTPRLLAEGPESRRARAVGTVLLVVFLASLAATLARLQAGFVEQLAANRRTILDIMLVVAPAVVIGGQIGPWVARRLSGATLRRYVALVLLSIGVLLLIRIVAP